MAWKEHPGHRCEHCGYRIGRSIRILFNGNVYPNRRKTCDRCRKKGCLVCMTGNAEHGILQHKDCDLVVAVAIDQLLHPSRHKLDLSYGSQLVGILARLANSDRYMQKLLIEKLPEAESESLFPLVFAFVIAPESVPILRTLSGSSKWAGLALVFQEQHGEAQPVGSPTSD